MAEYQAPLRDMQFLLADVFKAEQCWQQMSAMQDVSLDLATSILEEGAKLCRQEFFPLNRSGDEQGCQLINGEVITPDGFKAAYQALASGGWIGLGGSPEFGGQGMPKMLTCLFEEMLFAANSSLTLYPCLCVGATLALLKHASDELKTRYLPNMYSGVWSGTMCLTEPHCGTDLGIMRTKAMPQADGSYAITGTKIFITGGDHDLADNIIHLVLAKLPDAPAGSRGISLFLVPKILLTANDELGDRNQVSVGSIEHKMGIKGSATCVMNFDGAKGWLIGEANQGLAAMFTMMNYERLSIGLQGLGSMEMAYQHASQYAVDRVQGRAAKGAVAPEQMADPIIVHADVRRMLLTIRAYTEAGRAFALYTGLQLDLAHFADDAQVRERAEQLVALLTPIAKAFLTDRGFEMAVQAQQVLGGHGYIREWGLEQLVRDARIAQIYEGTNGVQAMDLIGRKIFRSKGEMIKPLIEDIHAQLEISRAVANLQPWCDQLLQATQQWQSVTEWLVTNGQQNPDHLGAAAVDYLDMAGLVICGLMWLKMATATMDSSDDFAQSKQQVAAFFFAKLLPKVDYYQHIIRSGANTVMQMSAKQFVG
jgi:hypothetical protein